MIDGCSIILSVLLWLGLSQDKKFTGSYHRDSNFVEYLLTRPWVRFVLKTQFYLLDS